MAMLRKSMNIVNSQEFRSRTHNCYSWEYGEHADGGFWTAESECC